MNLVDTVELFLGQVGNLLAVFEGYDGGDFCTGLIFGVNGAQMLTEIATAAFQMSQASMIAEQHKKPK